jgi:hypothetical protein
MSKWMTLMPNWETSKLRVSAKPGLSQFSLFNDINWELSCKTMLRNGIRSSTWLAIPRENSAYECNRTSLPLTELRQERIGQIDGSKHVRVKLLHQLFLTEKNNL